MSSGIKIFRPWTSLSKSAINVNKIEEIFKDTKTPDAGNRYQDWTVSTTSDYYTQIPKFPENNFQYDCLNFYDPTHISNTLPQMFEEWPDMCPSSIPFLEPNMEAVGYLNSYLPANFNELYMAAQTLPKLKQRPKKFKCPHCKVSFSNNGQLKGHVRIHTGERPFKCDAEKCGKSFTRNEELTRHKRIHTGLRPFPCDHCGKKFGRKDHLKKHVRTHFPQPRLHPDAAHYFSLYPLMYGNLGMVPF